MFRREGVKVGIALFALVLLLAAFVYLQEGTDPLKAQAGGAAQDQDAREP